MKTRRLLTALTLTVALTASAVPAWADWTSPVGGPGGNTVPAVGLALEAAVNGLQLALVVL